MEEASLWTPLSNSCPAAFGVVNHSLWMSQELVEVSGKQCECLSPSMTGSLSLSGVPPSIDQSNLAHYLHSGTTSVIPSRWLSRTLIYYIIKLKHLRVTIKEST